MLSGLRDHNLVALAALEQRGFVLSYSTLRRLIPLLPTRQRVRQTAYLRRLITEEELGWLEWLIVLKQLGMTSHEVRAWLRAPDPIPVLRRIAYTERIVDRAKALMAQSGSGPRPLGMAHGTGLTA